MEDSGLNLNEILSGICGEGYWEFEFDKGIPKEYSYEDSMLLGKVIGNLVGEISYYRGSKRKAISKLENKLQIIELLSSGSPLSPEKLDLINRRYDEGAKSEYEPYRNGTKIAGYFLAQLNGTVKIENCNEEDYTVKNIIRLPA